MSEPFPYTLDADAICEPYELVGDEVYLPVHVFRHGWGRCVCGQEEWPGEPIGDLVTRERLARATKALNDHLPAGNPLWKPWAMDLADDVLALIEERKEREQ